MRKSILYLIILPAFLSLFFAAGCDYGHQVRERWICKVNADGSGFQRICRDTFRALLVFPTAGTWVYYPDLLIFSRDGLWNYYYDNHGYGQQNWTVGFSEPAVMGNNGYAYLTSGQSVYQLYFQSSYVYSLCSFSCFLGAPLLSSSKNYLSMAGLTAEGAGSGEVIINFNPNNYIIENYVLNRPFSKVCYLDGPACYLCFSDQAVFTYKPASHEYRELYAFSPGDSAAWHSRYCLPFSSCDRFLLINDDHEILAIDVADTSKQVIGHATPFFHADYGGKAFNLSLSNDELSVYYTEGNNLCRFYYPTGETTVLLQPKPENYNVQNYTGVRSAWNGEGIYFIADLVYQVDKHVSAPAPDR